MTTPNGPVFTANFWLVIIALAVVAIAVVQVLAYTNS
jgi:hypothetical protein